jgi:hypothetical protein
MSLKTDQLKLENFYDLIGFYAFKFRFVCIYATLKMVLLLKGFGVIGELYLDFYFKVLRYFYINKYE